MAGTLRGIWVYPGRQSRWLLSEAAQWRQSEKVAWHESPQIHPEEFVEIWLLHQKQEGILSRAVLSHVTELSQKGGELIA